MSEKHYHQANRRQFLKSTFIGMGTAAVGATENLPFPVQAADPPVKNPFSEDPLALRKLTDNITCSRIGLGTGMSGGHELEQLGAEKTTDLIRYCYDVGIRLFDTADSYHKHQIVGESLRDKPRDSFTLVSKMWVHYNNDVPESDRPDAETLVKRFLKELGTDYIDLLQLHCMLNPNWPQDLARYMDGLEKLKEQGLIRSHGVTCHSIEAARIAAEHPWVEAIHLRLNPFGARMDGSVEDNVEVVRTAQKNGKGVIIMKVLGEGTITDPDDQQKSIDFIVNLDATDVMVVGLASREHVDTLIAKTAAALKKEAA